MKSYKDTANNGGNFLYGGLLDRCKINAVDDDFNDYIYHYVVYNTPIVLYRLMTEKLLQYKYSLSITSDPYQLCFCKTHHTQNMNIQVHKGETFIASLLATAQGGNPSSTSVNAKTSSTAKLKLHQSSQILRENCTSLEFNVYSTNKHELVVLYPNGPCRDTGLARATINITFLPCPSGFSEYNELCICEKRLRALAVNCTIDDDISIVKASGTVFWVSGLYNNGSYQGLMLSSNCPENYCKKESVALQLDNPDIQCAHNRIGILCGACATNYSLVFGSSQCEKCSNTYLALLLPFAAAGIALVVFLSLFRLTVATGMINSVILYANIIQANRHLFFKPNIMNILTTFIAWLNLDLGLKTCFYHGMDAYAQIWLQFAFPIFVWSLICLIILFSRYSIVLSKLIGRNPIAVLATLLLMSYTKILKIVINVYSSAKIDYPDNKTVTVWLNDGNIPYFRSKHLLLTVVTSLVLLFLFLPYTLLLLLGYKLYHFSDKKYLHWLTRLKPLLDSYYAPYKSHTRYWTGFLLLVRCVLYTVFSYNPLGTSNKSLLAIIIAFTTIGFGVGLILLGRIYNSIYANIIEMSIYFNLILISGIVVAQNNSPATVYSLVGVVFATMIGIIVYHFYITYTAKSSTFRVKMLSLMSHIKNTASLLENNNPQPIEPSHNSGTVTKSVIELREPLLESKN